jgi:hypothetical protein
MVLNQSIIRGGMRHGPGAPRFQSRKAGNDGESYSFSLETSAVDVRLRQGA